MQFESMRIMKSNWIHANDHKKEEEKKQIAAII